MEPGTLLVLLLLLACPLMMVWMMRGHGGHGHHGEDHGHDAHTASSDDLLPELRRRRAELDAEIERLERDEAETMPAARA